MNKIVIYNKYRCYELNCTVCDKILYIQVSKANRFEKEGKPIVCKSCTLTARNKSNLVTSCTSCGVKLTSENEVRYGKNKELHRHSTECKTCFSKRMIENTRQKKIKVLEHYGNKCTCCGETRWEFLTIDHVNNDGNEHRRLFTNSTGTGLYQKLLSCNFEVGYELQVLCWNCNEGKRIYGICPHEREKIA